MQRSLADRAYAIVVGAITGFGMLLWLRKEFPHVPVTLLGFNSHKDELQTVNTTINMGNGFVGYFHSFRDEGAAIDSMFADGVERCGV